LLWFSVYKWSSPSLIGYRLDFSFLPPVSQCVALKAANSRFRADFLAISFPLAFADKNQARPQLDARRQCFSFRRILVDLKQGVDERRDGRALGEHDDSSQEKKHDDHWHHPPEFLLPEKLEQLASDRELRQKGFH
jgi:hypothetical protein